LQIHRLSPGEREIATRLAEAVLPPGKIFPGANSATVDRYEAVMRLGFPGSVAPYRAMLRALDVAAIPVTGRRFSSLSRDRAEELLEKWRLGNPAVRGLVGALTAPLKIAHFDDPAVYGAMGCVFDFRKLDAPREELASRVTRARDLPVGEAIECDVVVVGTGAGGAVVGKELAEQGLAVVLIEEGELHSRNDVSGRSQDGLRKFYRDRGFTFTVGNTVIPIPIGRMVGGSTAINQGTCWRTPERVLRRWREECGLAEMTMDHLAPYFEKVERTLQVEPVRAELLGGVARVVARGAQKLGYHHLPISRNAPDCDGSGVCSFGCPTDARRSTNVSYVPPAIRAGAQLITGATVEKVLIENGQAAGIEARVGVTGARLVVRARATILSCGSFHTPTLLLKQGLANASGEVGKNLSIHPSCAVSARFPDEKIDGARSIPQSYCVDQFHDEGILLMGASAPLEIGAQLFPFLGRKLMEVMEGYDRVASFGIMVEDKARGRVRVGPNGLPLASYWLGRHEIDLLRRGIEIVARIFLAAGADEVYPRVDGHDLFRSEADLGRFKSASIGARDFLLTGFHPLGTCRMGPDPRSSVVDANHQTHDLPGLYIVDGSAVPTSVAVNPQVTIMTLATRAAERIGQALH
jgi:choline dehydrogenase-like flavoprotein